MNTTSITDKAERKVAKRAARKKAAPKAKRASGVARVDTLVKTKVPALVEQEISIDTADIASTEKLYPLVQKGIRGGFFQPNRSHFMCSKKYCAFWRACEREFGGRVE